MKLAVSTIFAARVMRLAAALLTTILTARFLGPTGQGEFFFVITLATLIAQFGTLGLASSNTYLVARNAKLLEPLVVNSLWLSVIVAGGLGVVVITLMYTLGVPGVREQPTAWFAAVLAAPSVFVLLGQNLLLGLGRTMAFNAIEVISSVLVLLTQLTAGVMVPTPAGFLVFRAVGLIGSGVAVARLLVPISTFRAAFDTATFRVGLAYSFRAYLVTLLGFLVLRINVFGLQEYRDFAEIGFYSVATQVASAIEVIPTSVSLALFPKLLRMDRDGWAITSRSLLNMAVVMVTVCVFAAIVCEPLMHLAFGSEFAAAVPMLRFLLPQVFFIGLTAIASQYLAARGMPPTLLAIWAFGVVASGVFGRVLIPLYGGEGAAIALSLAYVLIFILVMALALTSRPRQPSANSGQSPTSPTFD
jgi:antigen flippase